MKPRTAPTRRLPHAATLILAGLALLASGIVRAEDTLNVPRIAAAFPASARAARALRSKMSAPVALRQSWRRSAEPGFLPADARLAWDPEALWILAEMSDRHVGNHATQDNSNTWELGDAFEVFVSPPGSSRYAEIHVTPENRRLGLWFHGGDADQIARGKQIFEHHKTFPLAEIQTAAWKTRRGWTALLRIPWKSLGCPSDVAGRPFRISLCRYDASPGSPPVLSSSSPHKRPSFHNSSEWHPAMARP